MSRSKYGAPRAKFGQIKLKWGYSKYDGEDLFMCYGGHQGSSWDSRLLMHAITDKQYSKLDEKYHPSLLEELEKRGYDIKTLTISIEKKPEELKND